ncbi:hypothetical protein BT96DRAFT_925070 [Gymnopus androsaceus JB14]|uniref:Uncharacterized protein n=1 Tax=Gymnopus androsaceus JB14 TaxID=1447944 RepID=A0A6A4H2C5_9AGAR|nr:hypothetical protein BT96DRAFT_925070 [Gymnopus androsaceus JB14]
MTRLGLRDIHSVMKDSNLTASGSVLSARRRLILRAVQKLWGGKCNSSQLQREQTWVNATV